MDMNNATHILAQLGGQDFLDAVGAGCLACYDVGVSFTLPAWVSRWGINHVKIAANDIGLYDIAFANIDAGVYRIVRSEADIEGWRLLPKFCHVTGLVPDPLEQLP